jgi:high-affinity Fe2+/Pb2+ permease
VVTRTETQTVGGAALVGLLAFATGIGTAIADTSISAAQAALTAGTEAFIAAVVAGVGGWLITHRKPETEKTEVP